MFYLYNWNWVRVEEVQSYFIFYNLHKVWTVWTKGTIRDKWSDGTSESWLDFVIITGAHCVLYLNLDLLWLNLSLLSGRICSYGEKGMILLLNSVLLYIIAWLLQLVKHRNWNSSAVEIRLFKRKLASLK